MHSNKILHNNKERPPGIIRGWSKLPPNESRMADGRQNESLNRPGRKKIEF